MYNVSALKNYDSTSYLVRFENKNILFYFEKTLQPTRYNTAVVVVNSDGLASELRTTSAL
jgi:hypothetical protein